MKKVCVFILCVSILSICVSACTTKTKDSLIKSKRHFAQYPESKKNSGIIDLSDGKKLRYDANFGPETLKFDFRIENPY